MHVPITNCNIRRFVPAASKLTVVFGHPPHLPKEVEWGESESAIR